MTTTAMFVEIVVVGVQVLATLSFFAASAWGLPSADLISFAAENPMVATLLVAPWVYLAGIVGDRLADMAGKRFLERYFLAAKNTSQAKLAKQVAQVLMEVSEYQNLSLVYFRTRLRILRSAIWHVPLMTIGLVLLLWLRTAIVRYDILSAGVVASVAVAAAYRHMSIEWIGLVQGIFRTLTKKAR